MAFYHKDLHWPLNCSVRRLRWRRYGDLDPNRRCGYGDSFQCRRPRLTHRIRTRSDKNGSDKSPGARQRQAASGCDHECVGRSSERPGGAARAEFRRFFADGLLRNLPVGAAGLVGHGTRGLVPRRSSAGHLLVHGRSRPRQQRARTQRVLRDRTAGSDPPDSGASRAARARRARRRNGACWSGWRNRVCWSGRTWPEACGTGWPCGGYRARGACGSDWTCWTEG